MEIKSKIYAEVEILEYWVISLRTVELIVFRDLTEGMYHSQITLTQGVIDLIALLDVTIDIRRLLA